MKKGAKEPKALIIVESPTKAKTLSRYLGRDYLVKASVGHIKDLPVRELGVDIENDFDPNYRIIKGKGGIIKELKQAASRVEDIYLAPDPDREGEAIAWHIAEEIRKARGETRHFHRVLFKELTKRGIKEAMASPVELDRNKYDSQRARRILDRLVGYELSPLLWQKVKRGLSAGRVQSVALRLICDREREIREFKPEEYWTITAELAKKDIGDGGGGGNGDGAGNGADKGHSFEARFYGRKGKKVKIKSESQCKGILDEIKDEAFIVKEVKKKEVKKGSPPPLITSTLQQEASKRLRFSAKKTMQLAQRLYEGVDIGEEGPVGLITYMRTDSTRISDEARSDARVFIEARYGKEFLVKGERRFKRSKLAQDAHEAIRPTSVERTPDALKDILPRDEYRLYDLIWRRFLASQMAPAIFDQTQIKIEAGSYAFRSSGSILRFSGFMVIWKDIDDGDNNGEKAAFPPLVEGEALRLIALGPKQHFTQPPPRYTEAGLIKTLEEKGIGRPSTYAAILSNIRQRDYVKMEKRHFVPTELGMIVAELLKKHFPDILNTGFTAQMESRLDQVETGEVSYVELLRNFYDPFKDALQKARKEMRSFKTDGVSTDIDCPECGSSLVIRYGRRGEFLACSAFPECKFTSDFERDESGVIKMVDKDKTGIKCPKCGRDMALRRGRYGEFLACTGYPACETTMSVPTGVKCPQEGCGGNIVKRFSQGGKVFYGCDRYPSCRFATWDEPVNKSCAECGAAIMVKKGNALKCLNKKCNATLPLKSS